MLSFLWEMNEFFARTAVLDDYEAWMAEWNGFCLSVKPAYRRAIAIAFEDDTETPQQNISHYLDCEAHSDVWRQLYPTWNGENLIEKTKFQMYDGIVRMVVLR